jgi:hypothetical protein
VNGRRADIKYTVAARFGWPSVLSTAQALKQRATTLHLDDEFQQIIDKGIKVVNFAPLCAIRLRPSKGPHVKGMAIDALVVHFLKDCKTAAVFSEPFAATLTVLWTS